MAVEPNYIVTPAIIQKLSQKYQVNVAVGTVLSLVNAIVFLAICVHKKIRANHSMIIIAGKFTVL